MEESSRENIPQHQLDGARIGCPACAAAVIGRDFVVQVGLEAAKGTVSKASITNEELGIAVA